MGDCNPLVGTHEGPPKGRLLVLRAQGADEPQAPEEDVPALLGNGSIFLQLVSSRLHSLPNESMALAIGQTFTSCLEHTQVGQRVMHGARPGNEGRPPQILEVMRAPRHST